MSRFIIMVELRVDANTLSDAYRVMAMQLEQANWDSISVVETREGEDND